MTHPSNLVEYLLQPTGNPEAPKAARPWARGEPGGQSEGKNQRSHKEPRLGTEDSVGVDLDDSQGSERSSAAPPFAWEAARKGAERATGSPNSQRRRSAKSTGGWHEGNSPIPIRNGSQELERMGRDLVSSTCRTAGAKEPREKSVGTGSSAATQLAHPLASAERGLVRHPPPDSGPACQHQSGDRR